MEAIGIKKSTNGKINTIEDIVYLFVERETYKFQKLKSGVDKVDEDLTLGLQNATDKSVSTFWESVKEMILEKLSKTIRRDRPTITDHKMLEWIEGPITDLRIADLPNYSASRIENIEPLKEFERKITNSVSRRLGMDHETLVTLNHHVSSSIISPSTWLHQKQMVDDFIFFTILNDLCSEKGVQLAFNTQERFCEVMTEKMPILITEELETVQAIHEVRNAMYPSIQTELDLYSLSLTIESHSTKDTHDWKYLYPKVYPETDGTNPLLLNACCINNHMDYI